MKNKKGFTLTEMMVVVLILAGLAAIAYPVYTKVIMKARLAEAFSLAEIVREAEQRSLAVNGTYFIYFKPSHISGRTRLIKSGDVSLEERTTESVESYRKLKKGLYTVTIPVASATHGNYKAKCVRVSYGESDNNPIFAIHIRIEDSRIWCEESNNGNGICGTIPSLETGDPECGSN